VGKHAAVAFVHGSGPTGRVSLPDLSALLLRQQVGDWFHAPGLAR
jgi:hypothetical protein